MDEREAHLLSLDNTRWTQGVSALLIMMFHFFMLTECYSRIFNIVGSVCVAAFLFISGFGLNESFKKDGLSRYWRKRTTRVIVPYCMLILFTIPFIENFDYRQFIHNIVFTESYLWFINYIIFWYVAYWIARKFVPRHTTVILLAFSTVCIFFYQLMSEQAFSFFAGYMASQHYDRIKLPAKGTVAKITAAAFIYGVLFMLIKEIPAVRTYIGTLPFNLILLNIKLPLAISLLTAPYLFSCLKKMPGTKWLGRISYEIYLVHVNFTPYISGAQIIPLYMALTFAISDIFNRFNRKLKENFMTASAALLYIGISYTLMCKYSMRVTDHFGYVSVTYAMVLAVVCMFLSGKRFEGIRESRMKPAFFIALILLATVLTAVQYHFDPTQNKVDRWSAIANPLTALFNGEFPYLANTHLGGYGSPFPVWMIFHIPFWILGNVGLSEIFSAVFFLVTVKAAGGYKAALKATILSGLCINLWYETAVRSDLISNFLMLGAFLNILIARKTTFLSSPYTLSSFAGLWLSTRLSTAFPLFIAFLPYWLRLGTGKKSASTAIVICVFAITFLPLVMWDYKSLFFAEYNPFTLQTRQGHLSDTIILVFTAAAMAMTWKGDTRKMMYCSALILILACVIPYVHKMYETGNWALFSYTYDITYLDAALPFLISAIVIQPQIIKK